MHGGRVSRTKIAHTAVLTLTLKAKLDKWQKGNRTTRRQTNSRSVKSRTGQLAD